MKKIILFIAPVLVSLSIAATAIAEQSIDKTSSTCQTPSKQQVEELFNKWNAALQTQDPKKVAALYADDAVLLPTLSNKPRTNHTELEDYFISFLKNHPSGKIGQHEIRTGCNWASDTGLYTFTFKDPNGKETTAKARFSYIYELIDGKWLIVSHHSSLLPNAKDAKEGSDKMKNLEQSAE